MQLRGAVLVEGTSDRGAVETLARRRGRDLQAEGVAIVPMGGYGNLPRLLGQYRDVRLAGLYDVGEERHFLRALGCDERGELERVGFYSCTASCGTASRSTPCSWWRHSTSSASRGRSTASWRTSSSAHV